MSGIACNWLCYENAFYLPDVCVCAVMISFKIACMRVDRATLHFYRWNKLSQSLIRIAILRILMDLFITLFFWIYITLLCWQINSEATFTIILTAKKYLCAFEVTGLPTGGMSSNRVSSVVTVQKAYNAQCFMISLSSEPILRQNQILAKNNPNLLRWDNPSSYNSSTQGWGHLKMAFAFALNLHYICKFPRNWKCEKTLAVNANANEVELF